MRAAFFHPAILSILVAGCAPRPSAGYAPMRDREELLQTDLVEHHFANAYEAVEALRPNWMQVRGANTLLNPQNQVIVYLNDTRLGGVDTLRQIATPAIVAIRHFDGRAATARWGLDHGQGVILVTTF